MESVKLKVISRVTELLAPAKDKETAFCAIDCGADAVYMGAPAFGARKNAPNSLEDIREVVNYAHKYWARVHITLNTILTDSELDEAVELAHKLADIGVDALIIQDMGLLERLMNSIPSPFEGGVNEVRNSDNTPSPLEKEGLGEGFNIPPLHMSTQCDNYLPEKVKFFNNIGVSRVILARELSIEQIKKIHEENPNLELESFIHGALCVSMSGQCYLSRYIGGRSANRGECAQPCRKKYDVIDEKGEIIAQNIYPLCLKDFNGSKYVKELIDAGICSFKIEGRLKDKGYVKNIVAYYRELLGKGISSGRSIYPFVPNPEKSFNRGFTTYFLNGREECFSIDSPKSKGEYLGKVIKVNKESFVVETDKEICSQDGLYFNNDGCLVNKAVPLTPTLSHKGRGEDMKVEVYPNKKVSLKIGDKIYRNFDSEFEKALEKPVKRQIGVNVKIFAAPSPLVGEGWGEGFETNLKKQLLTITDEDGVSITTELPYTERAKNPEKMRETFIKQFSKTGEGDFYISDIKIAPDIELLFLPISRVNQLRRELFDKLMQKRLEVYEVRRTFQKPMKHAKYFTSEIDYRGNVHNKQAKEFYEKCGAEVLEPSFETKQPDRQVELMRCKHCVKYALNMCKSPQNLLLRDEHNKLYPLKFNCQKCEMSIVSCY